VSALRSLLFGFLVLVLSGCSPGPEPDYVSLSTGLRKGMSMSEVEGVMGSRFARGGGGDRPSYTYGSGSNTVQIGFLKDRVVYIKRATEPQTSE
jgi:hypothetical protein